MERFSFIGPLTEANLAEVMQTRQGLVEDGFRHDDLSDQDLHGMSVESALDFQACSVEGAEGLPIVDYQSVDEDNFVGIVRDGSTTDLVGVYRTDSGTYGKVQF